MIQQTVCLKGQSKERNVVSPAVWAKAQIKNMGVILEKDVNEF